MQQKQKDRVLCLAPPTQCFFYNLCHYQAVAHYLELEFCLFAISKERELTGRDIDETADEHTGHLRARGTARIRYGCEQLLRIHHVTASILNAKCENNDFNYK